MAPLLLRIFWFLAASASLSTRSNHGAACNPTASEAFKHTCEADNIQLDSPGRLQEHPLKVDSTGTSGFLTCNDSTSLPKPSSPNVLLDTRQQVAVLPWLDSRRKTTPPWPDICFKDTLALRRLHWIEHTNRRHEAAPQETNARASTSIPSPNSRRGWLNLRVVVHHTHSPL